MKTIATVTKLNALEKKKEIEGLIDRLHNEDKAKQIMLDNHIEVDREAVTV